MKDYLVKYNELTPEQFIYLWESVWDEPPTFEQTKLALENTLVKVSIFDDQKLIAMARAIGDKGLCYYIKDVIVHPDYQAQGVGRMLIDALLKYINDNGVKGTDIFVELCAAPDKMPFYEKCGFAANESQRLKMMYEVK